MWAQLRAVIEDELPPGFVEEVAPWPQHDPGLRHAANEAIVMAAIADIPKIKAYFNLAYDSPAWQAAFGKEAKQSDSSSASTSTSSPSTTSTGSSSSTSSSSSTEGRRILKAKRTVKKLDLNDLD